MKYVLELIPTEPHFINLKNITKQIVLFQPKT